MNQAEKCKRDIRKNIIENSNIPKLARWTHIFMYLRKRCKLIAPQLYEFSDKSRIRIIKEI